MAAVTDDRERARTGVLLGLGAFLLWGLLPLYFVVLAHVGAIELFAHRVIWSVLFLALLLTLGRRWPHLRRALARPGVMAILGGTAILIACNWLVYIWAVLQGHVLEGSLGYYLNPLVNVLLGVVLLRERLNRTQTIAVLLATAGVAVRAVGAGTGLWISLALALSFSLYGFLRKIAPVESTEGLAVETLLLAPFALGWLVWLDRQGQAAFGGDTMTAVLLVVAGAVTTTPLLLFTAAARRLPYSTLGFIQYLAPSLQFILAVWVLGEQLTAAHLVCFAAIWTALVLFAVDGVRSREAAIRERLAAGL